MCVRNPDRLVPVVVTFKNVLADVDVKPGIIHLHAEMKLELEAPTATDEDIIRKVGN